MLLNLILNACDAMSANPPAGRQLTMATAHRDGVVRISVSDTGCGLPPDAERIFEPFYTTKKHGLGLGLPICRSIATAHKGRLWAEAQATAGATFHLELPALEEVSGFGVQDSGGKERGSGFRVQEDPAEYHADARPGYPEPSNPEP